jgi:hypothetical protein
MAEPVGGKGKWKEFLDNLQIGLDISASIIGLVVLAVLPLVVIIEYGVSLNTKFKSAHWDTSAFWISLGSCLLFSVLLALSVFWALLVLLLGCRLLPTLRSRMSKKQPGTPSALPPAEAPSVSAGGAKEPNSNEKTLPAVPAPSQPAPSPEQARKQAELDLRAKVEHARKAFRTKAAAFKDSLAGTYDLNVAEGVVQFAEKLKSAGLKVELKGGSLRSYLTWDHEAMTLSVNDPVAFIKDRNARFILLVSDPDVLADKDLKDEVKPEELEIVVVAKFPSVAQRFLEWKSKTPVVFRLENAKQGQEVDYDIKALLGYEADWVIWSSVEGGGTLKADLEAHRLHGEASIGTDTKIQVVFTCPGCPSLRHELALLLTCNMDAEQRWKQIEKDESDKEAVLSEEERLKLAKMADAVRSTANAYEVRKPDDIFSKPHRVSRRQQAGVFDLAYASIRGRSHIRGGSFREDDVEAKVFLDGKAVAIVVSDGAGSAPLSRRGSDVVTSVGIRCLMELGQRLVETPEALKERSTLALEGFVSAVQAIRGQIEFEADSIKEQRPDFQAKEMYATFLAALVLPTEGGQVLLSYSVGDGAIGLGLAGSASGLKCAPDHGQSAGQTLFILNKGAEDADKRLVFTPLPETYALLLMSDGVSDPRFQEGDDAKPEAWDQLAASLQSLVAAEPLSPEAERKETYAERGPLCTWLDSYEKGHHDDRTIAVLLHKLS